uniref:Uncharacterized protein n=1 Tax=Plectus sambesii TaxID=2011161 RepID=A0A914VD20_9BILA
MFIEEGRKRPGCDSPIENPNKWQPSIVRAKSAQGNSVADMALESQQERESERLVWKGKEFTPRRTAHEMGSRSRSNARHRRPAATATATAAESGR